MAYNNSVRFEWDPTKAEANRQKHGLSFHDAKELFTSGTDFLEIYDEEHSEEENRFIAIGPIRDRRMTWNSDERRINGNIGRKFAGEELVLSATGYAGAYVDGTAFYIDPHTLTDGRIVTVSATNSGGTATVDFELIVVAE